MKQALVRCIIAAALAAAAPVVIAQEVVAQELPKTRAEALLQDFPESPPASCGEFSRVIKAFSGIAAVVVAADDDHLEGYVAVVDSLRMVILATTPGLQPLFAPVWSSTALCALRFDRRADAITDLIQGVAALEAMRPLVERFKEDPVAALEELPPEEHCRLLVTLMSSVAGARTLLPVASRLIDEARAGSDIENIRWLQEDLEARDAWLLPVETLIGELFE